MQRDLLDRKGDDGERPMESRRVLRAGEKAGRGGGPGACQRGCWGELLCDVWEPLQEPVSRDPSSFPGCNQRLKVSIGALSFPLGGRKI